MIADSLGLGSSFQKFFQVVPALTPGLEREAYRIRHEVYCSDLSFEDLRADGLETDEYDRYSLHCLLRSVATGAFIGCSRLVFARPADPAYPFPFERTCAGALDRAVLDPLVASRDRIVEVSRLAVVKEHRRRRGEQKKPISIEERDYGGDRYARFPYIPVGLYLGLLALCVRHEIETAFLLTEPRLATHLAHIGFNIKPVGTPVEHRGTRVPSAVDIRGSVAGIGMSLHSFYRVVVEEVEAAYREAQTIEAG